ncbi:hypothetical protein [Crocinitomix algicola]|uniref:hypothetical protein n=1 Tax=Crocinitomix algicola TaxID=1740263 RepID=UPI00087210D4|nr:hypothetical protein [Crocinitomix algicola]
MRTKISLFFSIVAIGLTLIGCFKREEYPVEPSISNPVIVDYKDSIYISFDFTDGDGDIGLSPEELDPPFNEDSYYYYNIYIDYYEKDDEDGWVRGRDVNGDSVVFPYRIKPIIVKGKARGIKGTMDVSVIEYRNKSSEQSDTIKYAIKLIDKALNESNLIETEPFYPN